ncbi:MAG: hypothetical protein ABEJ55_06080 [Halanaeroarchaeum sp.]
MTDHSRSPDPGGDRQENVNDQFERLPQTAEGRRVEGRPTRKDVLEWWEERFDISPSAFQGVTFWEKGAGRIWALTDDLPGPVRIEALGLPVLRTRQEFWKPTTDAAQRFGHLATRNVVTLSPRQANRFVAGEDVEPDWDGDWGYLIASHEVAGGPAPIGVGLYTYGTLQSMMPKGRRRTFGDR